MQRELTTMDHVHDALDRMADTAARVDDHYQQAADQHAAERAAADELADELANEGS